MIPNLYKLKREINNFIFIFRYNIPFLNPIVRIFLPKELLTRIYDTRVTFVITPVRSGSENFASQMQLNGIYSSHEPFSSIDGMVFEGMGGK